MLLYKIVLSFNLEDQKFADSREKKNYIDVKAASEGSDIIR